MAFKLSELQLALGRNLAGDPELEFSRIQFDSRRQLSASLFVALPGRRTDGRRFVAQALAGGAHRAVVDSLVPDADPDRQIQVDDPLAAMARLATLLRQKRAPRAVVGITGSNGKTTTKDMVAAALQPLGRIQKSQASFNAEIGVPVTITDLDPGVDFAVVELGAQEVGEITRYCRIADPTDAVITNIGHAHIGLFGSRENIAFAKGELGAWLRPEGNLVLNADDPYAARLAERTRGRVRWISERDSAAEFQVSARPTDRGLCFSLTSPAGCADVELPTLSPKVGLACAAAAAIADSLGVHIHDAATGMAAVTLAPRRMQVLARSPYLVIDDSYNANFESGTAALQALAGAGVDGRRVAVLGEMLELGPFAAISHADLGAHATDLALLLTVGQNARLIGESARSRGLAPERWRHFEADPGDAETVAAALDEVEADLRDWLRPGDALLVKGSNALNLAQVANRIAADQS
ncbi:MAG: UDP-N-acetylmuramoyl-tripeptide--D-alanyl-D-alanine ligase [Chloroflexota bacterium]|nr:UDP-N-acetylmuramoyl-tripeptide--D-alanyl-D-alanine ligase [Chloroflexota bacterium]